MTTDYKVTGFFCIIDEFCKHFDAENAGNLLEDNSGVKRRRRAASLSDSERYPYAIISGDMPIRFSRELPLTEKEQWVGAMALNSTLSGSILALHNAIPLRYNFYEGTQQFKILSSRKIRTIRINLIFELNGTTVFL